MSLLDHEPIATAIKAAIEAELPAGAPALDLDGIPGTPLGDDPNGKLPPRFVVVEIFRTDTVVDRRSSGEVDIPTRSLITRCHAQSINDVRELRRCVGVALESRSLPLDPEEPDGDHIGPFVFEIGEPEDDDDAGWVGADHWAF